MPLEANGAKKRALELMERVGLSTTFAKRYPVQLSGGQQQRVGVARALAADPPVMLMDEPFSAVDPIVREGLQAEFLRLQAELGKTIAMVTHDIDEAVRLGDTVAVFQEGGRIAQVASTSRRISCRWATRRRSARRPRSSSTPPRSSSPSMASSAEHPGRRPFWPTTTEERAAQN